MSPRQATDDDWWSELGYRPDELPMADKATTASGSAASAGSSGSSGSGEVSDEPATPGPEVLAGSAGSSGSSGEGSKQPAEPGAVVLAAVRDWLGRFIATMDGGDLDLLVLWVAHTWLVWETYTTPRLVLDSPVPESGKTTTLEHLSRLCRRPVQAASLSSPALLPRMLSMELRTILIDEVDRSLRPDKEGVADLIAVLNSGYKRGASRPVLVPIKGGGWTVDEMPTFAPVAMAGNNPDLPDDTLSRCLRVILMPPVDPDALEESDWELIEPEVEELAARLSEWADAVRDDVRVNRPELPSEVKARARERWQPLARVAAAAGGRWPAVVRELAVRDVERIKVEREDDLVQQKPGIVLLRHIAEVWLVGEDFVSTEELIDRLVHRHPEMWSVASTFGKQLTAQRMGRMLVRSYGIRSDRPDPHGPRGYRLATLAPAFGRFGLTVQDPPPAKPDEPARPAEPVQPALIGQSREEIEERGQALVPTARAQRPGGHRMTNRRPVPPSTPWCLT